MTLTPPTSNGHEPQAKLWLPRSVEVVTPPASAPAVSVTPLVEPSATASLPTVAVAPALPPITRKGRIGEYMAWGIAGIAWALSFASQVGLALQHGFRGWNDWEALSMALLSDGVATSMMFLSLDQAERGKPAKLTWVASLAAAGMMEWSNIVFALPDPVAVALHAWPPLVAVFTVFVLVHVRRTNAAPTRAQVIDQSPAVVPAAPTAPEPEERAQDRAQERAWPRSESAPESAPSVGSRRALATDPETAPKARAQSAPRARLERAQPPRPAAARRVARDVRKDHMRALLAEPGGRALTSEEMAARLGIDAGYARKLRAEVERAQSAPESA